VFAAVSTALLALNAPSVLAATPNPAPAPTRAENPTFGPNGTRNRLPDQMPSSKLTPKMQAGGTAAAAAAGLAPFLTRPYWGPHTVTSVFDHCNPDYTRDGRVCEFDGTVASSSNGVDPYFSAGYAITPGGTNYLYYDGHNGWDLALNYEPLMAAAQGVVQIAGYDPYNPGFGQTVTIDHGNGFTTRYAHMSSISVTSGQAVRRGQGIGVSGNTGNSTGPHLHFGLYLTAPWTAIDPWGWTGGFADPWPADAGNAWLTGNPQNPVPTAPTGVTAVAGDSTVTVTWSAPSFDGGEAITGYTVTAQPGNLVLEVPASGMSTRARSGSTT
jgi:prepilin-type processing-associated H-X9-DG protein